VGLLEDVDTIQELTDILVSDTADTEETSAGLSNLLNVVTAEVELILSNLGVGADEGDALRDLDSAGVLLTKEVADLDGVLVGGDFHREVRSDDLHLVEEALGDTSEHVLDVGDAGAEAGGLSAVAEPLLSLDLAALLLELELELEVGEVLGESATRTSDGHLATSKLDLD